MIKCYSELIRIPTFEERFQYLKLDGRVGDDTFGFDRFLNQQFYRSQQWKSLRNEIILRDNGCDLAMEGYDIYEKVIIHHMNPIRLEDVVDISEYLINPEYLICTTLNTHNAIHYGNENNLLNKPVERTLHDTCPWKR